MGPSASATRLRPSSLQPVSVTVVRNCRRQEALDLVSCLRPFPCAVLGDDSAGELKDRAMMNEAVDNGSGRHFVGEHLQPLLER